MRDTFGNRLSDNNDERFLPPLEKSAPPITRRQIYASWCYVFGILALLLFGAGLI